MAGELEDTASNEQWKWDANPYKNKHVFGMHLATEN